MPKVKVSVSTGYVGSKEEDVLIIDDLEWLKANEAQREELLNEVYNTWLWDNINANITLLEEADE